MTAPGSSQPARSVFYGFGAWVGRLDGRTSCAFWAEDPGNLGFDAGQLIEVDLAKNPAAYLKGAISIDQIEVDDGPGDGGLTRLGPTWPTGSTINGVWLESRFYDALSPRPAFPQPFMSCAGYELTTAIYWTPDGRGIQRRCWGFHCEIAAERGSLALCTIWTPGTSRTQKPAGSWWIDLATQADPIANGLTVVGTGTAPKQGALFLDAIGLGGLALAGPKLPPYLGGTRIPRPRR